MAYTTIDNPELFFQCKTYTGNGSTQSITLDGSENMQPDLIWLKQTNASNGGISYDSVRGANKKLDLNTNNATDTQTDGLSSFDSDGFSTGANDAVNDGSDTYVAWCWKAGTSFSNDASATSVGSIDSSGTINTTSGISIVTYTGAENAGDTVAHGLGAVPSTMFIKKFSASSAQDWIVYHHKNTGSPQNVHMNLNNTSQTEDLNTTFNDTAPTSTVFSLGSGSEINASGASMVAYCFTDIQGYSKFGKYSGNSSTNGTFVYTGFKPAYILLKNTGSGNNWNIFDNKRNTFNVVTKAIAAQESGTGQTADFLDFLSNGFKFRSTDSDVNGSGSTYIYFAFAESPQVNSKGVPNNAE